MGGGGGGGTLTKHRYLKRENHFGALISHPTTRISFQSCTIETYKSYIKKTQKKSYTNDWMPVERTNRNEILGESPCKHLVSALAAVKTGACCIVVVHVDDRGILV